MPTVAILYGFAEGSWQGRKLKQALAAHNLESINNSAEADIIIAHSAGAFLIPKNHKAYLVMLIGPNYDPTKSLLKWLLHKIRHDYQLYAQEYSYTSWLKKDFVQYCLYFATSPSLTSRLAS